MALITDFASLCSNVALWATRVGDTDFEAAVPTMVQLATTRLNSEVRTLDMERFSTGLADANGYSTLPTDFLGMRSVFSATAGTDALGYVTPDFYAANYPLAGVPTSYTIIGNQLRTWPSASGSMTMIYYQRIPTLSALAPTNWLLAKYPSMYLYACLLEAAPFMEEDTRAATWKAYYDAALAGINRDDTRSRYPNGVSRVSQETP